MSSVKEPSAEDLAVLLDYLDGHLSEMEMMQLEVRLSEDPALAEAFESLESFDRQHRAVRHGPGRDRRGPRPFRFLIGGALLAAAAAVVAFLFLFSPHSTGKLDLQVALLDSPNSLADRNANLNLRTDLRPNSIGSRGPESGGAEPVPDQEYYELARRAELDRARRSLETEASRPSKTIYFQVALHPEKDAYALVIGVDAAGHFRSLVPDGGLVWSSGLLTGGVDHLLPSSAFEYIEDDNGHRLELRLGFLIPKGASPLRVLVAARAKPVGPELVAELTRALGSLDARGAIEWLDEHGFSVIERSATEE